MFLGRRTPQSSLSCLPLLSIRVVVFTIPKWPRALALTWVNWVSVVGRPLVLTARAIHPAPIQLPPFCPHRTCRTLIVLLWTGLRLPFRSATLNTLLVVSFLSWSLKAIRMLTEGLQLPQKL